MVIRLKVLPEILTQVLCLTLYVTQKGYIRRLINYPLRESEELHLLKLLNYWRPNNENLWTKRNIIDYLSHPDKELFRTINYSPLRHKYRKELQRMDMDTKVEGGAVYWNYILNNFI